MNRRLWLAAIALPLAGMLACPTSAQTYPARPLRLVVPFTPAGATDVLARVVAEALGRRLGQPVVVENRPGAGGNVGAQLAAQSAADGYSLLMAPTSVYAIAMSLYRTPGYDLQRDFAPVSLLANVPHVLVVHPSLGVRTLGELVARVRTTPQALSAASQGAGTVSHLEAELLQQTAHVELVHVPYKGSAPAMVDLIAGRVQLMFDSITSALPQIRAGKLVALAVTGAARSPLLPDVPSVAETLPGYRTESWIGILVPAKTPVPIVARLNREIVGMLQDPGLRRELVQRGFEPRSSSMQEYEDKIRADIGYWGKIVRASGAVIE